MKRRSFATALMALAMSILPFGVAPSAQAATYACPKFHSWEDWLGGARVHASVSFRPSDICNGHHVKRAYVHLIRECGPHFDPGRVYTPSASSTSDTRTYSASQWIFDSIVWSCNTSAHYGVVYF